MDIKFLLSASLFTFASLLSPSITLAQESEEVSEIEKMISQSGIETFLPALQRGYTVKELQDQLREDWYMLYFDTAQKSWHYDKAKLRIRNEQDDCLNDFSPIVKTIPWDSLLLIKGLPASKQKLPLTVPSVSLSTLTSSMFFGEGALPPGKTFEFKFNGVSYTLEAKGKMREAYEIEYNQIYLSVTGSAEKQLIWDQDRFKDSSNRILFIGDLDGDQKPDFIIDVSDDYETQRTALFLSSHAKGDELVRLVDIAGYHFDC